jgi:dTDP-4-amino-4,6-dideoxygalactose transaminase
LQQVVKTPDMKPWEYEMRELGFNYRITDIQCALGRSQLKKLDRFVARRRELAKRYDEAFADDTLVEPLYHYSPRSSYHLYVVLADFARAAITKEELFVKMRERGIGLQLHYMPVNRQPYYRRLGYGKEVLPVMDRYYERCFSLPLYPELTDAEQDFVIENLMELLRG